MSKSNNNILTTQILKDLGILVEEAIVAHNLTQSELAKDCGVSQATISKIKNGEQVADLSTIRNVAKKLKIDEALERLLDTNKVTLGSICTNPDCNEVLPFYSGGEIIWRPRIYRNQNECVYGHKLIEISDTIKNQYAKESNKTHTGFVTALPLNVMLYGIYEDYNNLDYTSYLKLNQKPRTDRDALRESVIKERQKRTAEHDDFIKVFT